MENIWLPVWIVLGTVAAVCVFLLPVWRKKVQAKRGQHFEQMMGAVPPEISAYDLESIAEYYKQSRASGGRAPVDDATWDDLEMDAVFSRMNACLSSAGEEYLYKKLHEPCTDCIPLRDFETFIAALESNPALRLRLQQLLFRVGKSRYNHVAGLIHNTESKLLGRAWAYPLLALLPAAAIVLMFFSAGWGILLFAAAAAVNGIVYYFSMQKARDAIGAVRYLSSVMWFLDQLFKEERPEVEAFLPGLKNDYRLLRPALRRAFASTRPVMGDLDALLVYLRFLFFIDIIPYNRAMKKIAGNKPALKRLYEAAGSMDAALCVLSYRKSVHAYCRPEFWDKKEVSFSGMAHPLVEPAVENSLETSQNCLITGSNASGKTTFIKAVAVNAILAQTVHTCLASQFRMPFAHVMTSMAIKSSVVSGESYFIAEIKSLGRILDRIGEDMPCLCFIDEILRGTNTTERIAASYAVLCYLADKNALCFVASHDIELAGLLQDVYRNLHFSERIEQDGIVFDYKLHEGYAKTKNAIRLLSFMGFDAEVCQNAEALAERLEGKNDVPG
ncbi:MAG: MutS-related protein [Christensenellaceae bacterium]|jgi:hypothetical protein